MKKKLSVRAAVSLLLSALLFCMPVGAFMANSGNTVDAYAEGTITEESGGASEENSTEGETEETAGAEESTETGENLENGEDETGETKTESGSNEEETESGTVSGNEVPEPECTCNLYHSWDCGGCSHWRRLLFQGSPEKERGIS